jgi:hypothetical protein
MRELTRAWNQQCYRDELHIPDGQGRLAPYSFSAVGYTIEMAIQWVAYVGLTMLSAKRPEFYTSPFSYIPCGYIVPETGEHFTLYHSGPAWEDDRSRYIAQFVQHHDRVTQALLYELDTVCGHLWRALHRLSAYTDL